MENLITELAGYLIILMTVLYTYLGYAGLRKGNRGKTAFLQGQMFLILLIHLTGYLLLYMQKQEIRLIWLYLSQLILLTLSHVSYRSIYKKYSPVLFAHMEFLLMTGFVFQTRLSFENGVKQTVFAGVTLFLCLIVPTLIRRLSVLKKLGWLYGGLGIALLVWVLVAGKQIYGATNWVEVFGVAIQPSELVKLLYVFMLAAFLSKKADFKQIVLVSVLAAVHVLVLVAEKDLGGALIFYVTYVLMIFVATRSYWYLLAGAGGGVVAAIAAYSIFYHVQVRVLAWQNPWDYIDKEGYQVAQSLFGIGTGGWFGMGLGYGLPGSIPVVDSDFIFAGISEELGGIYGLCLILVHVGIFLLWIELASKLRETFYRYVAMGCCSVYMIQVFLSVGGVIKLIPSTGVTLPLISYGGSSLVCTILMYAIVQGLSVLEGSEKSKRQRKKTVGTEPKEKMMAVAYGALGLFLVAACYFSYYIFFESAETINNSYNKRQELFARDTLRGEILAADETVLAYSIQSEDGTDQRIYPYAEVYSHFVGRGTNGKTGVEALKNFELLTSHDNEWKKLQERLNGKKHQGDRVVTTVDTGLQMTLDASLSGYRGAAVVLDPSTGKILAMVSKPDYDPNSIEQDWEMLTGELEAESRLLNRATNGMYPPGSTFKVITALEYMREHPDWEQDSYWCTGTYQRGYYRLQCFERKEHEEVGLIEAFSKSCNTYFTSRGMELDQQALSALTSELLFNRELPMDFPHKASSYVLTAEAETDEVMHTMIGQGKTQMSPVHNAMIASAIANGGVLMKPYAVDRVETYEGELVEKYWPESHGNLMTGEEADQMSLLLRDVVVNGTGRRLSGYDCAVYGKTGTAEYVTESGANSAHSWFMGYAEQEDGRKIAFSVILEGEGRGERSAVRVVEDMLSAWK